MDVSFDTSLVFASLTLRMIFSALHFLFTVQSRPCEGFLTQSVTVFLRPDRLFEASDRQHIQPGEHRRRSQAHGGQQEHGKDYH